MSLDEPAYFDYLGPGDDEKCIEVTLNDVLDLRPGDFFRYKGKDRWAIVEHAGEPNLETTNGPLPAVRIGVYFEGARYWCFIDIIEGAEIEIAKPD